MLFGFVDAVAIRLQGLDLPSTRRGAALPGQTIQTLPALMSLLLGGVSGRSRAPAVPTVPYFKKALTA